MRIKIRKGISLLKTIVVLSMVLSLTFAQTASAGSVETGQTTNTCTGRLFGFEDWNDGDTVGSNIPGLRFSATYTDWLVGDFTTMKYNGKYPPRGIYTSDGDKFVWLGKDDPSGRIYFTVGAATYFSLLVSTASGIALEAYDADGNLLDRAPNGTGLTGSNTRTGYMDKLTVSAPNMAYVIIHDTKSQFMVDDICTDAPATTVIPEFPTIALPIISVIGLMLFFQRRRYK